MLRQFTALREEIQADAAPAQVEAAAPAAAAAAGDGMRRVPSDGKVADLLRSVAQVETDKELLAAAAATPAGPSAGAPPPPPPQPARHICSTRRSYAGACTPH